MSRVLTTGAIGVATGIVLREVEGREGEREECAIGMSSVATEEGSKGDDDEERSSEAKRQMLSVNWNLLPEDLLARILSRLPFSSLVRSRGVCRKWRDLTLSPEFTFSGNLASKCVPIYFYQGPLQVYNSRTNAWEQQSLQFLEVPLASLALLVSAGGLLCFKNKDSGDFVVCNPITKKSRVVQLPAGFDHGAIKPPQAGREWIVPAPVMLPEVRSREDELVAEFYRTFGREGIVGLLTEKYERSYKLIVAGLRDGDSEKRPTLIYDSLTGSWTRGSEVPTGVRFWESGKPLYFNGALYCLTWSKGLAPGSCALRRPWSIVKYHVKKDCWSEYNLNMCSTLIPQLVEHRERGYVVQKRTVHLQSVMFYEELEKPEETARLLHDCHEANAPAMGDWCVGQGDCFYIGGTGLWKRKDTGFSVLAVDLTTGLWTRLPTLFDCTKPGPSLTWLRTLEASMTAAV
ncbi:hypothetical protein MPTK1_3g10000 [Marchantia polymorpha subsp. ruderalis]|uniref:F-box domain-containing protein n=2 Tax=Marchantia polymorpha TaxID=3197 RepID=A0AAF6AZ85_MARPO|nr:hypothetical protein MARPO_0085s0027 [Marchantia polymorpha]BBN05069.1 hypothetical protein Mp_3g10000 [Marchantia polymorpha subsp. ruderalis]|eukprot:PTQ33804.1 hypothetical protein MARPO_0085s0027 [Marchantia polymorpha]